MISRTDVHPPSDYYGEELCLRCGVGRVTGWQYANCTDPGYTHRETCVIYNYTDWLCELCEEILNDD